MILFKLFIGIILAIFITYELIFCSRGAEIFVFRKKVSKLCKKNNVYDIYLKGPGFNRMLLTNKPITLESFYSKEEIDKITNNNELVYND